MSKIIGWDIGGAHLKVCVMDANGIVEQVIQIACPMWKGLNHLRIAFDKVKHQLLNPCDDHVVTMTGELADCFINRHVGVCEIASLVTSQLGANVLFYAGKQGLIAAHQVVDNTQHIASMNWHASASWLALQLNDGLMIDIGSTTTDLIPIKDGQIIDVGYTDAQRMANNSLVYTGMVRTPLMAVAQKIKFLDSSYHVAAEHFATTADVYRLLKALPSEHDLAETADGQGKSSIDSARRLARMVGYDFEDYPMNTWITLAKNFKSMQMKQLTMAAKALDIKPNTVLVGAGLGCHIVKEIASQLKLKYLDLHDLLQSKNSFITHQAVVCFPAYAVARLAIKNGAY